MRPRTTTTGKARCLRNNPTDAEKLMWEKLKRAQAGVKFRRQHPVGKYIVDFCCLERKLVIEIDGGQHGEQQAYDNERTAYLENYGYKVLRFWNNEVLGNIEGVWQVVRDALAARPPAPPSRKQEGGSLRTFSSFRADFPILAQKMNGRPLAYLDTAASAQKPQAVIDAMNAAMTTHYANIHRGLYALSQQTTAEFEAARGKIAKFIGVSDPNEVIFTRNATESINLVAQSWGRAKLKAGDEVILSAMEHHANIVPWQMLRDQVGIVLKIIPVLDDGRLDIGGFEKLLSTRTRMVALTHVSNALGIINPIFELNDIIRGYNSEILFLVDGSQAVVHTGVELRKLGCDFYVFTGHKLYGPTGIGVLWGRKELLESMPPYQGGGDMIEKVTFEKTTYKGIPARFEAGTPAIVEAIGLGAAVDYLTGIGMDSVATHEGYLLPYAMEKLNNINGLQFFSNVTDKAGIISFTADWGHISDIAMILDQCGVAVRAGHHCCMPLMQRFGIEGTLRASFGLYSNEDDIDALAEGLEKAKAMLS